MQTFEGHKNDVLSVCLSADGRWALSGSTDKMLHLWEVSSGRCVRTFEGHTDHVTSVCLSADGRWVLSVSYDKTLRLWELSSGRCVRTFEGHTGGISSVRLSADGRWALSGGDKTLRLWELSRLTMEHFQPPATMALCRVVTSAEALRDSEALKAALEKATEYGRSGNWSGALAAIRKARSIDVGERNREALDLWHKAGLRGIRKGLRAGWHLRTFEGHKGEVNSVCLSADGRRALSASSGVPGNSDHCLWDVSSGRCVRTIAEWIGSVCLSADGRWALSGGDNLRLWDVSDGQCVRTFEEHKGLVSSVHLSADGRWALSGSYRTLRLWEVSSGRCVQTFGGHHSQRVNSVCLSADGRWALSGGDNLHLWDLTGMWDLYSDQAGALRWPVQTFRHGQEVNSVCLSADGRWALSGSTDKMLHLWEVSSGRCVRTFEGHTDRVNSVCLCADGRWALSGSLDKTLRLWEVSSGRCVRTFEGHTGGLNSVTLSADGRWALSGSSDKTLRLWELDWDYEASEPADWDEGARPYLENFIAVHTPYAAELPKNRQPSEEEIGRALTRTGIPSWTERDFDQLLQTLACAGYGWLHPEGVMSELKEAQRQQEEAYRKDEERRRQEKEARRKAEEEAWNRSLPGRISNFFRGKKPGKR